MAEINNIYYGSLNNYLIIIMPKIMEQTNKLMDSEVVDLIRNDIADTFIRCLRIFPQENVDYLVQSH